MTLYSRQCHCNKLRRIPSQKMRHKDLCVKMGVDGFGEDLLNDACRPNVGPYYRGPLRNENTPIMMTALFVLEIDSTYLCEVLPKPIDFKSGRLN